MGDTPRGRAAAPRLPPPHHPLTPGVQPAPEPSQQRIRTSATYKHLYTFDAIHPGGATTEDPRSCNTKQMTPIFSAPRVEIERK